jgi:hypothetical protein
VAAIPCPSARSLAESCAVKSRLVSALRDRPANRSSRAQSQGIVATHLSPFKLASNPEYRLCGRSLRTEMPTAFLCPTSTSSLVRKAVNSPLVHVFTAEAMIRLRPLAVSNWESYLGFQSWPDKHLADEGLWGLRDQHGDDVGDVIGLEHLGGVFAGMAAKRGVG